MEAAQKSRDSGCRASRAAAADAVAVAVVAVDALVALAALLLLQVLLLALLVVGVAVERGAQQRMQWQRDRCAQGEGGERKAKKGLNNGQ